MKITDEAVEAGAKACPLNYFQWRGETLVRCSVNSDDVRTILEAALPQGEQEPVQDTWFTDGSLPVMAMSGDVESDRVLKLHFRRPVTDADRKSMTDALNLHQASLAHPSTELSDLRAENERLRNELAALRKRYEDWRPVSETPDEYHRQLALIHFYMPGEGDDEASWITRTWRERPAKATHWCLINAPLGPRGDRPATVGPIR